MVNAEIVLMDMELRGLVSRGQGTDGSEVFALTDKGKDLASEILASLSAEHFVLVNMLLGHQLNEIS